MAGGVDNRVRADDALLQRRHGGEGLKGGAGGVGAGGDPVEEGHSRIGVQRLQVLGVGPLAVVGVGGQGQDAGILHGQDHRSRAPGLQPVLGVHLLHPPGQDLLHLGLEVDVDGQGHGAAGLRLDGVELPGGLALLVGGDQPGAVLPPEVGLKGLLHPVPAHGVLHVVLVVGGGILSRVPDRLPVGVEGVQLLRALDGPGAAQNVGGVVGIVLPDGPGLHHHAVEAAVVEQGDEVHRHILRENIGGHIEAVAHQPAQLQLVEDPQHQPGLLLGAPQVRVLQAEVRPHQIHQGLGGELAVHRPQLGLKGGAHGWVGSLGSDLTVGPPVLRQVPLEAAALGGGGGGSGVDEGLRPGEGEGVGPLHAAGLTLADQPQHRPGHRLVVALALRRLDQIRVDGDGVALPVAHQHLAVAVGDDPPGRLHRLRGGDLGGGPGQVGVVVHHLGVVEHRNEQPQAQGENPHQNAGAEMKLFAAADVVLVHGGLLFILCREGRGRGGVLPLNHCHSVRWLVGAAAPTPPFLMALCQRRAPMGLDSPIAGRVGEKHLFLRMTTILFDGLWGLPGPTPQVTFSTAKK